jgi:hypothetical protein
MTKALVAENYGLLVVSGVGVVAFATLWNLVLCHRPVDIASSGVATWWVFLCAVSVCNACAWHRCAMALGRYKAVQPGWHRFRNWQLLLSAAFVVGCGFRSIFPRADVQRIGLFDSWLSSVLVGRSVATVAELCFMAQWALLMHLLAREARSPFGVVVSWLIVPLIVIAELFSWHAVLTTAYIGSVVEESLWALTASLMLVSGLVLWQRCRAGWRPFLAAALVLAVGYVTFLCTVDIPMYVSRWLADEASGREYLSLRQGLQDAWSRRAVTFEWEAWRMEIPWMTLYFSVCVWCSLALVHAPWSEPSMACAAGEQVEHEHP